MENKGLPILHMMGGHMMGGNIMGAGDLATQGAMVSATMMLTSLQRG